MRTFRSAVVAGAAIAALLPAVGLTATAHAATTIHVPADQPTIQAALDAAVDGDTVWVAPGTYPERISFGGKDVVLRATGGPAETTIDAGGLGRAVEIGPEAAIRGFTITNGTGLAGGGLLVHGGGTLIGGNVFRGNEEPFGGRGAAIFGDGASPLINANRFEQNTCASPDYDEPESGVATFFGDSDPTIQNNVFLDNSCSALGMTGEENATPHVVNNTFVRNSYGVVLDGFATSHIYRNNIFGLNGAAFAREGFAYWQPVMEHNLFFRSQNVCINTYCYGPGNFRARPLFRSLSTGDLHLVVGSPAIDAGTQGGPGTDFDGNRRGANGDRYGGVGLDIGAYEAPRPAKPPSLVSVLESAVVEGDTGDDSRLRFRVELDRPAPQLLRVPFSTAPTTAVRGDYRPKEGVLEFPVGATERWIEVAVVGDALHEADEWMRVDLDLARYAIIEQASAPGRIIDDDPMPTVSIDDLRIREGDLDRTALLRVRLSNPSDEYVGVEFATSNGTAGVGDFDPRRGTIGFPEGHHYVERVRQLQIFGDNVPEPTEEFTVTLRDPRNASLGRTTATVTIVDDD